MSKTAIVIGATGLVGAEVVNCLAAAEHIEKIVTITRRSVSYSSAKVENHVVEFDHLHNHSDLFQGDILFSCLGTTLNQAKTIQAQRKVDYSYQYVAAELAVNAGVERYLLVSSSGANSGSLSPYLKMKGELEDRVSTLPFKHISIFQPSLLLGERDGTRFAEGVGSIVLPTLCKFPGLRRYRPIHGRDVALKMVQVSTEQDNKFACFKLDEVFPRVQAYEIKH